jgi:hypothetical protein
MNETEILQTILEARLAIKTLTEHDPFSPHRELILKLEAVSNFMASEIQVMYEKLDAHIQGVLYVE